MTTTMNLTLDPWIPVIGAEAVPRLLSLQETFASAHEIRDLAVKPHEKIALLRLLVCISQAALDGPEKISDWETCDKDLQARAKDYLEKWQESFELFGDGPRFLQLPSLESRNADAKANPAPKLDLTLAVNDTATIFDNAAHPERSLSPARLALVLLTFQCFSPGGTIGVAKWAGSDTPGAGSSNHAPCIPSAMLHTYLQGSSLLRSIQLNLLSKEAIGEIAGQGWGKPNWESPVTSAADKAALENASLSYLGRLVPLARAIRLNPDGRNMILANGINYPLYPIYREAAATIVKRDNQPTVMGASLGRGIWRQLSAITIKRHAGDGISGPLTLQNLGDDYGATLWVGALATPQGKPGKIADVVEASYDIPVDMFKDTGRKLYEEGVSLAERWGRQLNYSIRCYWLLRSKPLPPGVEVSQLLSNAGSNLREHVRKLADNAEIGFWTAIEQEVSILLQLAGNPYEAGDMRLNAWGKALKLAANRTYELCCPHQSPREIEAFTLGNQQLYLPKPQDPSKPRTKRARSKTA